MARTSNRARKTSPLNLPGAFELFGPSKEIILKNIWIFGPLYASLLIFGLHDWILSAANSGTPWYLQHSGFGPGFSAASFPAYINYLFAGASILWAIFVLLAGFIVQIMSQRAQLDGAQGHSLNFDKLWATVKHMGWKLVGLYLLVGLYVLVGFILLIVPGIIMLRRYSLAPYIMMDKKISIRQSMETSANMTKPYAGAIYRIYGVMILIALIGIIPFLGWIISFWLGMLYSAAMAVRYQQLKLLSREVSR